VSAWIPPASAQVTTEHGVIRDPTFGALPGAAADSGYYPGGAYRIEIPAAWNGGLVIFAHGYRGEGPDIFVSDTPIREHLIARGYAWAASSYRGNSFRSDWGVDDTLALRDLFIQRYGSPRWTILYGQSMGGHVVVASLEQHPGIYQAGLAECGVLMGIEEYDYLAAYTAAADFLSGVHLLDAQSQAAFTGLVHDQWLPAMGSPGAYTRMGEQFDSVVKYLTGGDLPYREQGLVQRYTQNLVLLPDPTKAPAAAAPAIRAYSTRDVVFQIDPGLGVSAAELNSGVRRFDHAAGARSVAENPVFADVTGQITVPLMTLHGTGDAFVPPRFEQEYRRLTMNAGTSELLVQRQIRRPGHCSFTDGECATAFDDLVAWLEQGARPDGDDVLTSDLAHLGLSWTNPLEPDDPLR
jgi:pimeloyl-ACP methyl ester carboxylesterase